MRLYGCSSNSNRTCFRTQLNGDCSNEGPIKILIFLHLNVINEANLNPFIFVHLLLLFGHIVEP